MGKRKRKRKGKLDEGGSGEGGGEAEGSFGSLRTFVAEDTSGAVEGLLLVVDGQDAEDYRGGTQRVKLGDPLRGDLADVVEMRSIAADYAAEHEHGIVFLHLEAAGGGVDEFDGSRHCVKVNIIGLYARLGEGVEGAVAQCVGDMLVPVGGDDRDLIFGNCLGRERQPGAFSQ